MDDDVVNRYASELSKAIADAIADDVGVAEVCQKARAAGYDIRISLEAVVGFVIRSDPGTALVKIGSTQSSSPGRKGEMSVSDKLFLQSLRIGTEPPKQERA